MTDSATDFYIGSVPEPKDRIDSFVALWPWRFDYIWATHVPPGTKPQWHTADDYPLSDRKLLSGDKLYGVRFGKTTQYLMIDIDMGSAYHPKQDPHAIRRICRALEPLGLVENIIVSSSYSGGLHIYFPFFQPIVSWQLAGAANYFLLRAGFLVQNGLLELFPNPRPWINGTTKGTYAAHRLPMQEGSYLLDDSYYPIFSDRDCFTQRWNHCLLRNDPDRKKIEWAANKDKEKRKRSLTYKAQKFLNDLNADIEVGWSGGGQTNALLGRLALRAYVFGELLGYEEKNLTETVYQQAMGLPGFAEYCGHKLDLMDRCEEWARSVQKCSRYYPYGGNKPSASQAESHIEVVKWNHWLENRARDRVRFAIAHHLNLGTWPTATAARIAALQQWGVDQGEGFSVQTLYRHRDLWHPDFIGKFTGPPPVENFRDKKSLPKGAGLGGAAPFGGSENLLSEKPVNPDGSRGDGPSWFSGWDDPGRNPLLEKRSSDLGDDPGGKGD